MLRLLLLACFLFKIIAAEQRVKNVKQINLDGHVLMWGAAENKQYVFESLNGALTLIPRQGAIIAEGMAHEGSRYNVETMTRTTSSLEADNIVTKRGSRFVFYPRHDLVMNYVNSNGNSISTAGEARVEVTTEEGFLNLKIDDHLEYIGI